ncbi:MAG: hypothetical protein HP049_01040 [Clostridiales bacterium]|jgi:hypothetical protein|nr:hypothetical protein [Clostridiales bacterium]
MKKTTVAIIVFGLVLCFTVGGALAWLIDETPSVTNKFTYGDIEIDLTETSRPYEMVPGKVLSKDPKITVKADSEPCWLFVQVNESANLDEFIEYGIATGWHPLSEEAGVYYRHVVANGEEQTFSVLGGNSYNTSELSGAWNWSEDEVLVKPEVEKGDLNALDASGVESAAYPTLTFTAYAVQYEGFEDNPAAAWAQITSANTTTTTP